MRVAAGVLAALSGLGFGVPCAVGIAHIARTGEVWTFLGFPTYGGGPFERLGLQTSTPLLLGFLVVCIAELVVGMLLWTDAPGAMVVSLVILPVEFAYWIGFALPFGPILGIARMVLLSLGSR